MRLVTLFLLAAFAASTEGAASYQKRNRTIVDPILYVNHPLCAAPSPGEPHFYSGENLQPNANLSHAKLNDVVLDVANLTGSNLRHLRSWTSTNWTGAFYFTDNVHNWSRPQMNQVWCDWLGILTIDPSIGDFNHEDASDNGLHFVVKVSAVQAAAVHVADGVRGIGVDRYTQQVDVHGTDDAVVVEIAWQKRRQNTELSSGKQIRMVPSRKLHRCGSSEMSSRLQPPFAI